MKIQAEDKLPLLRGKLEKKRQMLQDQLAGRGRQSQAGENPDRGALAQSYTSRQKRIALEDSAREQLAQVIAALTRIEQGIYGICERCGDPIAPERLEALPQATLCIGCQAAGERF